MALANKKFLDQTKTNIWSYKDLNQMAQKLRRLYLGRYLSIKKHFRVTLFKLILKSPSKMSVSYFKKSRVFYFF